MTTGTALVDDPGDAEPDVRTVPGHTGVVRDGGPSHLGGGAALAEACGRYASGDLAVSGDPRVEAARSAASGSGTGARAHGPTVANRGGSGGDTVGASSATGRQASSRLPEVRTAEAAEPARLPESGDIHLPSPSAASDDGTDGGSDDGTAPRAVGSGTRGAAARRRKAVPDGAGGAVSPESPSRAPRFVALGDSLTEGVGDRVGDGWRGWASLLAAGIGGDDAPAEFLKLAVSGALTEDVAERQLPEALAFGPDIASVLVGVNDTLRCTFDIEDLTRRLDDVCARLTARGTVLLTACLPDPGGMLGLPLPLARPLARRQRAVNAVVHALSARYDAVHLHAADAAWVADRSMWSADRLHPGERGHRMIARRFHELLAERGLAHGTAPGCEPEQPAPTRSASLLWLATAGTGWVARRCTDLLPQLMRLAGAEVRHWARGTSARLDHSAELALSTALAAVSLDVPLARMGE